MVGVLLLKCYNSNGFLDLRRGRAGLLYCFSVGRAEPMSHTIGVGPEI